MAKIVAARSERDIPVKDLVEIKRLPYDWPDYPYIFYQCWTDESPEKKTTVAFRGNQQREGIADSYEPVPARSAASIARAVLGGAPVSIETKDVEQVDFREPPRLKRVSRE